MLVVQGRELSPSVRYLSHPLTSMGTNRKNVIMHIITFDHDKPSYWLARWRDVGNRPSPRQSCLCHSPRKHDVTWIVMTIITSSVSLTFPQWSSSREDRVQDRAGSGVSGSIFVF